MQFRHPESYRILSDGRILQDPMGSDVEYMDLGDGIFLTIVAGYDFFKNFFAFFLFWCFYGYYLSYCINNYGQASITYIRQLIWSFKTEFI
jgi:hypothetical protein